MGWSGREDPASSSNHRITDSLVLRGRPLPWPFALLRRTHAANLGVPAVRTPFRQCRGRGRWAAVARLPFERGSRNDARLSSSIVPCVRAHAAVSSESVVLGSPRVHLPEYFIRAASRTGSEEPVVKVAGSTETGEAPAFRQAQGVPSRSRDASQGATRENSGPMRLRSNAARREASPVECRGTFTTGS